MNSANGIRGSGSASSFGYRASRKASICFCSLWSCNLAFSFWLLLHQPLIGFTFLTQFHPVVLTVIDLIFKWCSASRCLNVSSIELKRFKCPYWLALIQPCLYRQVAGNNPVDTFQSAQPVRNNLAAPHWLCWAPRPLDFLVFCLVEKNSNALSTCGNNHPLATQHMLQHVDAHIVRNRFFHLLL